jgi:hypothetical protein
LTKYGLDLRGTEIDNFIGKNFSWEIDSMSEKVNEEDVSIIEHRRRNLKAAELLEQWMIEDANDDQTDWPAIERELQDSTFKCHEPEDA